MKCQIENHMKRRKKVPTVCQTLVGREYKDCVLSLILGLSCENVKKGCDCPPVNIWCNTCQMA